MRLLRAPQYMPFYKNIMISKDVLHFLFQSYYPVLSDVVMLFTKRSNFLFVEVSIDEVRKCSTKHVVTNYIYFH